jgi:hypothetical protein
VALMVRLRPKAAPPGDEPIVDTPRPRWRRIASDVLSAGAFLLVMAALVAPNRVERLTPGEFVRIPVEGVLAAALLLVAPARVRRPAAALIGLCLGIVAVLKVVDMAWIALLARSFDPVLDWSLFPVAVETLGETFGRTGAVSLAVLAVALAIAVPVLTMLSVLRLSRLALRHRGASARGTAVLAVVWVTCAALGIQLVPGAPFASRTVAGLTYYRMLQMRKSVADERAFEAQARSDPFRDVPREGLLTGLRGKNVIVAFVESYGRDAVENPFYATQVGAVLADADTRLRAKGFGSRSAFLTSPVYGGGSWMAHATLQSGLQVDNQQRFRTLVSSGRLTLTQAFRQADWRTVAVTPASVRAWPEASYFGFDAVYDSRNLGYRGPKFSYAAMPDQFVLSAFERLEGARHPVMAEIDLVSSHTPWAPIPRTLGWDELGDGSVFGPIAASGEKPDEVWRDTDRVRTQYRRSIEYSLTSLLSYVERYGDEDTVVVFLGDHQPGSPAVAGSASRDVPVTVLAHDPAVLERVDGWGWQDGLRPDPRAPVWPMSSFRDRFLKAFA